MKKLFEFTINKVKEVEEQQESLNEKQEKVITIVKVKKEVPQKFAIRRPNRELYDESDLFYAVELANGVKHGMLTQAMLSKRYTNDNGALSDGDKKEYETLQTSALEKEKIFQKLGLKGKDRTPEENIEYSQVVNDLSEISAKLHDFQLIQEGLFSQTAETRARNKTILWWILHLSYTENDKGELVAICGSGDYKERLKAYDVIIESEDETIKTALQRFFFFISFWYVGKAATEEDFKSLENIYTKNTEPLKDDSVSAK